MTLEKAVGNANMQRFRAILFLKVNFNTIDKIVFNNRLIPVLEDADTIPPEIIRDRRT